MAPRDSGRPRETGKQRAVRIPLDYFKRADPMTRWKLQLTGLALVLALAWWGSGLVTSDEGRLRYARGPVAAVHATWEANCEACHTPFAPIRNSHWSASLLGKAHESDGRCENCHAGPPHQARQKSSDRPACAGCHREHRGRDASLVRLPDESCTNCHRDLAAHMNGKPLYHEAITRFDRDHPQFRLDDRESKNRLALDRMTKRDPGRLKFNHEVHLARGMAGAKWKLDDIDGVAPRERYRLQQPAGQMDNAALVQLTCSACHTLNRTGPAPSNERPGALSPRSASGSMLPITYENHCRACHPLSFDRDSPRLTIPHRLQPREVHNFLWGAYAEEELAKKASDMVKPIRRPLPGTNLTSEEKKIRAEIDAKLANNMEAFLYRDRLTDAEKTVFLGKQTCGECHSYERSGENAVPERIVPPQVPEIWFKHALFDHAAHRALDCLACHPAAPTSRESKDVLLPGIETCKQCHSAPGNRDGKIRGGARFDCTECHRYHHGDVSVQGTGPAKSRMNGKRDIEQFLSGKVTNP